MMSYFLLLLFLYMPVLSMWGSNRLPLSIELEAQKVPQNRDFLLLNFTIHSSVASLPPLEFELKSQGVEVIDSPQEGFLLIKDGWQGSFLIRLTIEQPYILTVNAVDEQGNILGNSNRIYARLNEGNALILTHSQFKLFSDIFHRNRLESEANERALQVLQELKAQGLKVAVENWPHEEEFKPIANNLGLNLLADQQELLMDQSFLNVAISHPEFKDNIIVELEAFPGDGGCYVATISAADSPYSLYLNKLALIHFKLGSDYGPVGSFMDFYLISRMWIKDACTQTYKLKYVAHPVTMGDYNGPAVNVWIGYAASENFPIVKVKTFTYGDNIYVGECQTYDPPGPDWNECYAPRPVLIPNSWISILDDPGFSFDGIPNQIEHDYLGLIGGVLNYEEWNVMAFYRTYDHSPIARAMNVKIFPMYRDLKTSWNGNAYNALNIRACLYDKNEYAVFVDPCDSPRVIYFGNMATFSGYEIMHEAGHWFHDDIQYWLPHTLDVHSICMTTNTPTAYVEGFAAFFAAINGYLPPYQPSLIMVDGELETNCDANTDQRDVFSNPKSVEGAVAAFLWDLFDSSNHLYWDNGVDYVDLDRFALYDWYPNLMYNIVDFILFGEEPGYPLDGLESQVCDLQLLHGMYTSNCQP